MEIWLTQERAHDQIQETKISLLQDKVSAFFVFFLKKQTPRDSE